MIFEGQVTTVYTDFNFPLARDEVRVYTTADITIAFRNTKNESFGDEIEVAAPGGFVAVCGSIGRITGTAYVKIL